MVQYTLPINQIFTLGAYPTVILPLFRAHAGRALYATQAAGSHAQDESSINERLKFIFLYLLLNLRGTNIGLVR